MLKTIFYEGKDHFEAPFSVREKVFMEEQGFKNEIDEKDEACTHCVIFDDEKPIACGRFFFEEKTCATIGRIAVLKEYRKHHLGKKVMNEIEIELKKRGCKCVKLSAQCQAEGFYKKCGYKPYGDIYYDEHCPHIQMKKEWI